MKIKSSAKKHGNGLLLRTGDYHEDADVTAVLTALTGKRWHWHEIGFSYLDGQHVIYLYPGKRVKGLAEMRARFEKEEGNESELSQEW